MKIRACETGLDIQFVVTTESEDEKLILRAFIKQCNDPENQFWRHGYSVSDGLVVSFNFGTIKKKKKKPWWRFWL